MTPRLRKLALTAHITFSVGWLGAVAGFLVLSIAGLTSQNAEVVRGAYLAMNLIGLFIIVPMSLAAFATGLIQALGTEWGLLRHYWVLVKFILTILATIALLLHQFTAVAGAARRVSEAAPGTFPDVGRLGTQLVSDAGLALLVLLWPPYCRYSNHGVELAGQNQSRGRGVNVPVSITTRRPTASPSDSKSPSLLSV